MGYFFNFDKLAYIRGKRPKGCILCLIRDHSPEVENLTVFENSLFNVSLNLYPYNPGHLLIFPKRHLEDIRALERDEVMMQQELTVLMLDVLDATLSPAGYNIGYNMGRDAGASIAHLHLHIIPRYPREIGIGDLLAGKRLLVEDPRETAMRLRREVAVNLDTHPRSSLTT